MNFPKLAEQSYKHLLPHLNGESLSVCTRSLSHNTKISGLSKDTFSKAVTDVINHSEYPVSLPSVLRNFTQRLRPIVSSEAATKAAQRVTEDPKLQKALVELSQKEAIIIRTKNDAMPILRGQFSNLANKENVIVLDINPQINNGMQKSNTLISRWYTEANGINPENLVTLRVEELRTKALKPCEIHRDWVQGSPVAKRLERLELKAETVSMDRVREILDGTKGLSGEEILAKYSLEELAAAMKTINTNITAPQKQRGYIGALISQLEFASKGKDNITIVIPDDCSLSGSSMLCDSVKILDKFIKNNPTKKVNVVFSPLILGDKAQNAFNTFIRKDAPFSEMYLRSISAIKTDGTEAYSGIRNAFERVKASDNITFEVTPSALRARHFTETEYFKNIEDPVLKSKLTYIMQGPVTNGSAQFGGFGNCGTLVVTPTEEFVLNGRKYAGKIPTNSVGYMEILGHETGVLNDEIVGGKGLFTKGTGRGYSRYCEWEGLSHPETAKDRMPINIAANGTISVRDII